MKKKEILVFGKDINIGDLLHFEVEDKKYSGYLKYITEISLTMYVEGQGDMEFNREAFTDVKFEDITYPKKDGRVLN